MAIKDKNGAWIDSTGNSVPIKYVSKIDKKRDAMVAKLVRLARDEHKRLEKLRTLVDSEIDNFLELVASECKTSPNPGGNYTFTGFSGDIQVEQVQATFFEFDERLQFAKTKINGCLERWMEGGNENLKAVIYDAFKVDKKGRVDKNRILGLRSIKIKDKEWAAAMDLISESLKVTNRKEYIRFRTKTDKGKWETIRLDFASV